jgi:hypothetical protein
MAFIYDIKTNVVFVSTSTRSLDARFCEATNSSVASHFHGNFTPGRAAATNINQTHELSRIV